MKICYLDYDGVLHDHGVFYNPRRGIYISTPGRALFEWMPILEALLLPNPGVRIVLSTSWVHSRSYSFARSRLSAALQARVIGGTFHNRFMRKDEFVLLPRGVQVAQDAHRRGLESWFAIDDDALDWPAGYRDRLVHTEGSLGLGDPLVQEAVKQMLERAACTRRTGP